jgi:hypothetical protein
MLMLYYLACLVKTKVNSGKICEFVSTIRPSAHGSMNRRVFSSAVSTAAVLVNVE